jgi:hypothetical protein
VQAETTQVQRTICTLGLRVIFMAWQLVWIARLGTADPQLWGI